MRKSILAHKPNKKIFFTVTQIIKSSVDSTHLCRSPTPAWNACDLASPTRTEPSVQESVA